MRAYHLSKCRRVFVVLLIGRECGVHLSKRRAISRRVFLGIARELTCVRFVRLPTALTRLVHGGPPGVLVVSYVVKARYHAIVMGRRLLALIVPMVDAGVVRRFERLAFMLCGRKLRRSRLTPLQLSYRRPISVHVMVRDCTSKRLKLRVNVDRQDKGLRLIGLMLRAIGMKGINDAMLIAKARQEVRSIANSTCTLTRSDHRRNRQERIAFRIVGPLLARRLRIPSA